MAGMMMQPPGGPAQPLDTAQTAAQPQTGGTDPDEQTFAMLVAGLREHVFGAGEQGIVKAMTEADDPGRVLGEIVFALVREAAKQAEKAQRELDMDILMGVATELIDDITELMAGHGMQLEDKQREFALLYAQQLHVESSDPSDDERNAAKQSLAGMKESGEVDTAVEYVAKRGAEEGVDPFGMESQQAPGMMGQDRG